MRSLRAAGGDQGFRLQICRERFRRHRSCPVTPLPAEAKQDLHARQSLQCLSRPRVGIGLRIPHYNHIFARKPVVDWFEVISENFMIDAGRPLALLDRILEQYRVVQHGVSMYFGSATAPDRSICAGSSNWSGAPGLPGSATTSAGAAWTALTPTICFRCPTPGGRRAHRRAGAQGPGHP